MPTHESVRYPWTVRSVEKLQAEMDRARSIHGRVRLCGWYCAWLPDPRRVVRWDEAVEMVAAWQRAKDAKDENAK